MKNADKGQASSLDGTGLKIGIVQARFNEGITNALSTACRGELARLGVTDADIDQVFVPGALEIPLALQALADRGGYDALVALGCIIRGETYHFELVANESAAGVTRVGLDYRLPIANVILTTENLEQALARQTDKGVDAARVVVDMCNLLQQIGRRA
ncbi:MAG: putative riboflavin synthase, beta chain [Pseudomonadota bacterium]|jgi:6,7-dimethyl-8-ribityllumazine synthase